MILLKIGSGGAPGTDKCCARLELEDLKVREKSV
jgi:hypothetical protein